MEKDKKKTRVITKRINIFDRIRFDKTDLSKLEYAITYACEMFMFDDVISITIK